MSVYLKNNTTHISAQPHVLILRYEIRHEKTGFLHMRKQADQLRGNREADQRLCFRYADISTPLCPKSEISSLQPSSVVVQPGLCGT